MKSIRSLVSTIVIIIMVLISFALILNNLYLKPVLVLWDEINNELIEFNERYVGADLNIRVINNVVTQLSSGQKIEENRKERIISAYEENYEELANEYNNLTILNYGLIDKIHKLENYKFLNSIINIESLNFYFDMLDNETSRFGKTIDELSNVDINSQQNYTLNVNNAYKDLQQPLKSTKLKYAEINREVIPNFINLLNITLLVLFVIVLILSFLLKNIVDRDIKYLLSSFRLLNNGNYERDELPKLVSRFEEEKIISEFVQDIFKEKYFLNKIKEIVSKEYILDEIINNLLDLVKDTLNTDRIGVAFVDYKKETIIAEHGAFNYGKALLGPGFEIGFKDTRLTSILETKKPIITKNIRDELLFRPNSESLQLLDKEGIKSNMIIPLISNGTVLGFLFFSSVKENNYDERTVQLGVKISNEISNILDKTYLTKKMFSTATRTFASLVEKRDNETGNHIIRMTAYSKKIAEALTKDVDCSYRVPESFIKDIANYASIHDIGKIGIPDNILKKPGKLTEEERRVMQTHSTIGGNILKELEQSLKIFNRDFYKTAIDIANYHHERWDGRGYPEGLSGTEIPLAARIVSIADVFDALSSSRVYKDNYGFEESVKIINEGSGTQFDPYLVEVFNELLPQIQRIYEMEYFSNKELYNKTIC